MKARTKTLLIGVVVAGAIFAVLALAVKGTDPWTADAESVADRADADAAAFAAQSRDLADGKGASATDAQARAAALADAARDLANATAARDGPNVYGNASALLGAADGLDRLAASFGAAAGRGASPAASDLEDAEGNAALVAQLARNIGGIEAANVAKANDQATVVDTLFGPQVLALEILGILLTAAMIGALVIARPLDAPDDDAHYTHPTPAQVAESDRASDVKTHTGAGK